MSDSDPVEFTKKVELMAVFSIQNKQFFNFIVYLCRQRLVNATAVCHRN